MEKIKKEIVNLNCGKILFDSNLKKFNTYKISGNVDIVVYPDCVDNLIKLLKFLKSNDIKYKIIGMGSNLIFVNSNYNGVLILLDSLNSIEINENVVYAEAGCFMKKLSLKVSKMGLSGLEFATGIPGTVGGNVFMNAGAYKSDMGYVVSKVKVLDPFFNIKFMSNSELNFHYRDSFFRHNPEYVILGVYYKLKFSDSTKMLELIKDRKNRRISSQPLDKPSAGSVFRNPSNIPAGKVIEDCGLKGFKIGDAVVSLKHANFIINENVAKGIDILNLIKYIKKNVYNETGIILKEEQEYVE